MRSNIAKMLSLLTPRERRNLKILLVLSTLAAMLEAFGIASILPFIAVVANQDLIRDNRYLNDLFERFGFESESWFLVTLGAVVLVVFVSTNAFNALVTWLTMRFGWGMQHSLALRLLTAYMHAPYALFLTSNTARLSANVLTEVSTVIQGVGIAGMRFLVRGAVIVFIVVLLLAVNPAVSAMAFLVLGGSYALIFTGVRRILKRIGEERLQANVLRFKTADEALQGIKVTKLLGAEQLFLDRFAKPSRQVAMAMATSSAIGALPRYALASIAFGGMLFLVLFLLATDQDLNRTLPLIGLYAFAGYRLLPALQEMFGGLSMVRFSLPAMQQLVDEFSRVSAMTGADRATSQDDVRALPLRDRLELVDVSFHYPGTDIPVIEGMCLTLHAGTSVGIVGPTGAGKTTLVDLILGLIHADSGHIIVDGTPIDGANVAGWQKSLGYVQQDIYLIDDTVRRNIAFGVSDDAVDRPRVEHCAEMAQLSEFMRSLPDGLDTIVGERGVRLSGGQRQRIGIARALYRNPSLLVLDEATNALDGITESRILYELEHVEKKTIITVAHRVKAVVNCDVIYMLDQGRIVARGTYDELMTSNAMFKAMAGLDVDATDAGDRSGIAPAGDSSAPSFLATTPPRDPGPLS